MYNTERESDSTTTEPTSSNNSVSIQELFTYHLLLLSLPLLLDVFSQLVQFILARQERLKEGQRLD